LQSLASYFDPWAGTGPLNGASLTLSDIRALPKAEVHTHLESFDPSEIALWAREAGESLPRPIHELSNFANLQELLDFLDWSCDLLRTQDQLARAAYSFSAREARSGVGYADVVFNPVHWETWRHRLDDLVEGLDRGFKEAEEDGLTPIGLCVSLLRQQAASEAGELVDWMLERRHPRIVALSIDGNEALAGRVSSRFADAFGKAAVGGIHRTVHAGESSGPEGVWDAIHLLQAERIDHGVRAIEDSNVVKELVDRAIPLGVCPTSNVLLGLYPDLRSHPLEALRGAGVRVSVNTDGAPLTPTTLEDEYLKSAITFGWSRDVVHAVARTSIEASFCDEDTREELLTKLQDQPR
jgi:adenosine deaminase